MVEDTKQQFRRLVRKRLSEYSEVALKERSERIFQKLENHAPFPAAISHAAVFVGDGVRANNWRLR